MSDRPSLLFLAITSREYAPSGVRNYGINRTFQLISHKHSVLALTAWLREHDCDGHYIWIYQDEEEGISRIEEFIREKRPDAIGLSLVTEELLNHYSLVERLKKTFPHLPVIAGGPHVTAEPVHTLENFPLIDYVCIGEGEKTLTEWLKAIADGKQSAEMRGIPGLAFRDNSYGIVITEPREKFRDINILPDPAFDLIMDDKSRRSDIAAFPLVGSYGCRYHCTFCAADHGNYRFMSAERMVDQIERAQKRFGAGYFAMRDSCWPPSREWADRFCDLVERRKLKFQFHFETRAGIIDYRQIARLKKIGARAIAVGVESGDPEMLKSMKKAITLDMARRAFADLHRAGMLSIAFFMLGARGDNEETIERSIQFANELNPTLLSLSTFRPFPGTEDYRYIRDEDKYWWMDGRYPSVCDFTWEDLKRIREDIHIRYPLRLSYLRQHVLASRLPEEFRMMAWRSFKVHLRKYAFGISERYGPMRVLIHGTKRLVRKYG